MVVSAIKNETLNYYKTIAESAGFALAGLGLRPMASYRALKACVPELESGAVALISVRRHEVDVDILIDGRLVFSRELSVDLNLTEDSLELERNERLNHTSKEIFRCLHSYEGSGAYQKLDQLFIAGGTGLEDELRQQIQSDSEVTCSRMPLPTAIQLPDDKAEDAARALTSLGLALGFVDERGLAVNFLSPKKTSRATQRGAYQMAAWGLPPAGSGSHVVFIQKPLRIGSEIQLRKTEPNLVETQQGRSGKQDR